MAQAWRLVLNPNDKTSGYILWTNGRIDTFGSAVTALPGDGTNTPGEAGYPVWYGNTANPEPARALTITDWQGPSGYTSNYYGSPGAWGSGAPQQPNAATVPATVPLPVVIDVAMNPAGNGEGYMLLVDGTIRSIGNAPDIGQPTLEAPIAKRLLVDFATGAWYVLTAHGGIFEGNGAPYPSSPWPDVVQDWARDFYMDFSSGAGMVLDMYGDLYAFGGMEQPFGGPHWAGDIARGLGVVSDGTGGNPMVITILDLNGNLTTWTSSSDPVVTPGFGMASTQTATSRPTLSWSYSQAQGDAQASWKLRLFEYDYTQMSGFDPDDFLQYATVAASGTDPTTRSYTPTVDIPNGSYVLYVGATSTAGLPAGWPSFAFTQDVPIPDAPMLAALGGDEIINLTVTNAPGQAAGLARVEFVDDDGNLQTVRGAAALALAEGGTASAVDLEVPLGRVREYTATYYTTGAYKASPPSPAVSAVATGDDYLLTTPENSGGGAVLLTAKFVPTRHARGGTFLPEGRTRAVVISDGPPSTMTGTVTVICLNQTQAASIEAMVTSGLTLLLRDPHGHVNYLAITGNVSGPTRVGSGPNCAWTYGLDVTEVDRPAA